MGSEMCIRDRRMGFLTDDELSARAEPLRKSGYGDYLLGLLGS